MGELTRSRAWFVVIAASVTSMIMAGLGRMAGILYVAFIDVYHVDRKTASAPFSLRATFRYLLGPVAGILGQKYGVAVVTFIGALLGIVSCVGCFFAKDITWITLFWGGLNGAGVAFTITLLQVVIGQYFEKYTTTAAGIVFSSDCLTPFFFPVLFEWLLSQYGLEGTFLIIAAITMHIIPAAMILRTPPWLVKNSVERLSSRQKTSPFHYDEKKREENLIFVTDEKRLTNEDANSIFLHQCTIGINEEASCLEDSIDFDYLRKNKEIVFQLFTEAVILDCVLSNDSPDKSQMVLKQTNETPLLKDTLILKPIRDISQSKILLYLAEIANEMALTKHVAGPEFKRSCINKTGQTFKLTENISTNSSDSSAILCICDDNSVWNISEKCETFSWDYIFIKLHKILSYNDNHIMSLFSEQNHPVVLKLMNELRKIYILCRKRKYLPPIQNYLNSFLANKMNESIHGKETNMQRKNIKKQSNTFWIHIKSAFQLHSDARFLLICLSRASHFVISTCATTLIVDFGIDQGLLREDGKYLIIALSVGDLIGRLCFGWITDKGYISLNKYMFLIMVMEGICIICFPLMHTRYTLFSVTAIYGVFVGSEFVQHPVIVSKYMRSDVQSIAMGCINLFSGLLGFVLPSYIGYFRDTIGSYNGIFYINGVLESAVGFLWIFVPFIAQCNTSKAFNGNEYLT